MLYVASYITQLLLDASGWHSPVTRIGTFLVLKFADDNCQTCSVMEKTMQQPLHEYYISQMLCEN